MSITVDNIIGVRIMKRIVLTGGGTAGHVTPNIALLPKLKEADFEIFYIGTTEGMEKGMIEREHVQYFGISAGKLRRYLSAKNLSDIFRVVKGVKEASGLMKKLKPDVVFSKGGFVAVPVVLGAKLHGIPVIVHESDMTPGLANKLAMPFADKVCTTFPETVNYIKQGKGINTGTPIRRELFLGDKQKGLSICGFQEGKPVIMMMGGSLGSVKINTVLRKILPDLLQEFQLVHICGKGNFDPALKNTPGYCQFEFVREELPHIFAAAELVISRAGSNSICEFLALKKPNLLIPLSQAASRGDQILNAKSFETQGFSMVLQEEEMNEETLLKGIQKLYKNQTEYIANMGKSKLSDGVSQVMQIICQYGKS